ncbi:MAG: phosphoglucomutase/phosphomannomutase family protein [Nitrospirota bacterium]|nr:phosphoglucomutase/phosphomannomutase family protein [Nitrospirota bacterium]
MSHTAPIKFGTSGWRGIIADDFTFQRVKVVTQAIAQYLMEEGIAERGVVVGYDTRFLSERFALETARVLAANDIPVYLSDRDAPTPVISFEILRRRAAGGINFTASHNPPEYNGIKFSPAWGGPALPETTKAIENIANELMKTFNYREISLDEAKKRGLVTLEDFRPHYLADIKKKINFEAIGKAKLKVGVDVLYGTAKDYLDTLLRDAGCEVTVFHDKRDPYFGGRPPEPAEENIEDLIAGVKLGRFDIGLATDGDADRFGVIDRGGRFIPANYLIPLLLDYLKKTRGWSGGVARSVATSHLIDAVAKLHGLQVYETPVGFKFIGDLITQDKISIGGEESAGLTIKGHVPEKDGILACLLAAEVVAVEGRSLSELLEDIFNRIGHRIYTDRINIHLNDAIKEGLKKKLAEPKESFAGVKVTGIDRTDGVKYLLEDGSWLLLRLSGTEPVARLYVEAGSEPVFHKLIAAGKEFALS